MPPQQAHFFVFFLDIQEKPQQAAGGMLMSMSMTLVLVLSGMLYLLYLELLLSGMLYL